MTIDFCKPWSDEECRLFLGAIKKRKTEYCEERGLPVPAFDKVEDFYVEAGMMPGHEAAGSGKADMSRKRGNIPLTLAELREMDGEPVWISPVKETSKISARWMLVSGYDPEKDRYLFTPSANITQGYDGKSYGKAWLAYRHKP